MGRTLKRVPMSFNWPIGKTWGGYLNPFAIQSTDCPECKGSVHSKEYNRLRDTWYGKVLFRPEYRGSVPFTIDTPEVRERAKRNVSSNPGYYGVGDVEIDREANRLCDIYNSKWSYHLNTDDVKVLVENQRLWELTRDRAITPTPEEVNSWSICGMGHDSINCHLVCKAECKRLGVSALCDACDGEGSIFINKEAEARYEAWEQEEPPVGDGFQLWETTSEGSPTSPVFASLDELCQWAESNATTFGQSTATAKEWKSMLGADFVCHKEGGNIFI